MITVLKYSLKVWQFGFLIRNVWNYFNFLQCTIHEPFIYTEKIPAQIFSSWLSDTTKILWTSHWPLLDTTTVYHSCSGSLCTWDVTVSLLITETLWWCTQRDTDNVRVCRNITTTLRWVLRCKHCTRKVVEWTNKAHVKQYLPLKAINTQITITENEQLSNNGEYSRKNERKDVYKLYPKAKYECCVNFWLSFSPLFQLLFVLV